MDGVYDCTCSGFGPQAQHGPQHGPQQHCGAAVGRWNLTQIFGQRRCSQGSPNYMCWHENAAQKTGGMWYSTTSEVRRIRDGAWRVHAGRQFWSGLTVL